MHRSVEMTKSTQNLHLVEMQPKKWNENLGIIPMGRPETNGAIFLPSGNP
jgi:hypothetical protein